MRTIAAATQIELPKVVDVLVAQPFELSSVEEGPFEALGRQLADAGGGELSRKVLEVVADPAAPTGYRVVPTEASDVIEGAAPQLPFGGAERALAQNIYDLDIVAEHRTNWNGATRLAKAITSGAGGDDNIAAYLNAAKDISRRMIHDAYRAAPVQRERSIATAEFGPSRVTDRVEEENRYKKFDRSLAYKGWRRSQYPVEWFDSGTERDFANLLDDAEDARIWTRLHRDELVVMWDHSKYNPDFYAEIAGVHHLLEVKADRHLNDGDVLAKAKAAREWGRYVTDSGSHGTWKYLVVPQSAVDSAKSLRAALTQATNK